MQEEKLQTVLPFNGGIKLRQFFSRDFRNLRLAVRKPDRCFEIAFQCDGAFAGYVVYLAADDPRL